MQVIYQLIETDDTEPCMPSYVLLQFNTRTEAEKAYNYYKKQPKYESDEEYGAAYSICIATKEVYDSFKDYLLSTLDIKTIEYNKLTYSTARDESNYKLIIDQYENPLKYKDSLNRLEKPTEEDYKKAKDFFDDNKYSSLRYKLRNIKLLKEEIAELKGALSNA